MDLDKFIEVTAKNVQEFKAYYLKKREEFADPKPPMPQTEGDWYERFLEFAMWQALKATEK